MKAPLRCFFFLFLFFQGQTGMTFYPSYQIILPHPHPHPPPKKQRTPPTSLTPIPSLALTSSASSPLCCHGNMKMKRVTHRLNERSEAQKKNRVTSPLNYVPRIYVDISVFSSAVGPGLIYEKL